MATPNPPLILPPFDDATARLDTSGRMRRRDTSVNGYPITAFERRIALP
jgi:nuclear transport factor 2 (NTF2) superfamily protein